LAAFPAPDKWSKKQKETAVQFAALLKTAQTMIGIEAIAGINYQAEKKTFLTNVSRTGSIHTYKGYRIALDRLEIWTTRKGINPLELTPALADDFLYAMKAGELHGKQPAPASIRRDVAAVSSFYTFLHLRHTSIENPFRGTTARPPKEAVKAIAIPNGNEVQTIIAALPPMEAAAVSVMAYRGLRAGGLPGMKISGTHFVTRSKGKDITGELPPAALEAITAAFLPRGTPFAGLLTNTLEKRIARAIGKLYQAGKVKAAYSCHDFRHFYAVTTYREDHDIYRLCALLDHASIQVTESYLRSLKVKL
jgi:site-specific recombinase XerD